jgi:predicted nucleotidyltransferase
VTNVTPIDLAQTIIATLRAHEPARRVSFDLSLFGSIARGDAAEDSDVDLAVKLDPNTSIGLFAFVGLERGLFELVGRKADLLSLPVETRAYALIPRGIFAWPFSAAVGSRIALDRQPNKRASKPN